MRIVELLVPYFVCIILIVVGSVALNQRRDAIRRYEAAQAAIGRQEMVIDCLETMCRVQAKDIENLVADAYESNIDYEELWEDIDSYKARAEALEGRIQKMAGAYHVREMNLLAEIERLKEQMRSGVHPHFNLIEHEELHGRHNQSEARPRVAHTESPDRLSEDTGMGCGPDARERFSTRHSRFVPFQKGVWRKMGRR